MRDWHALRLRSLESVLFRDCVGSRYLAPRVIAGRGGARIAISFCTESIELSTVFARIEKYIVRTGGNLTKINATVLIFFFFFFMILAIES